MKSRQPEDADETPMETERNGNGSIGRRASDPNEQAAVQSRNRHVRCTVGVEYTGSGT